MRALLPVLIAVFGMSFLATPGMGGGWFWDIGNGIGFAAFAGLIHLALTSGPPLNLRAHQLFGYGVFALTVLHIFWFMLGDATVVEFVKLRAPDYMWHGVAAFLMLGYLIIVALMPERLSVHRHYRSFRYWHRLLAIAMTLTAAYHIGGSQFYLNTWYQLALFVALIAAGLFSKSLRDRMSEIPHASVAAYAGLSTVMVVIFALLRNLPA